MRLRLCVAFLAAAGTIRGQSLITTVAGRAKTWPSSPVSALTAPVQPLSDIAVGGDGDLYFVDHTSDTVLKLSAQGVVAPVAGNGISGFSGDGGPAVLASLSGALGVAYSQGALYIADADNNRVRKVTSDGIIMTVAGTGDADYYGDNGPAASAALLAPSSVALDSAGNLYIADRGNQRIRRVGVDATITTIAGTGRSGFSGDNGPAAGAMLANPVGIAVDAAGNIYVADQDNNRIRRIALANGIITTVAGTGTYGYGGDNGPAAKAILAAPGSVAVDPSGNVYIGDTYNSRVRELTVANGTIKTIAGNGNYSYSGDGKAAADASLTYALGLAVDASGQVYIADSRSYRVRRVDAHGVITTVAGNGTFGYAGDGGLATSALLGFPAGMAADRNGNVMFADAGNHRILKLSSTGILTTVAGNGIEDFAGDNAPAVNAALSQPAGVAFDAAGNLYIADSGNNRVRKVSANGVISTIAGNGTGDFAGDNGPALNASLDFPASVAVDAAGAVYISDANNSRIRKVSNGTITTYAGTGEEGYNGDDMPASRASLASPQGIVFDSSGNLYVADKGNHRVRKISPQGTITTVAGTGEDAYSGDNGPAIRAALSSPFAVVMDVAGDLFIADAGTHTVRKVAVNGTISAVAGTGEPGLSGDAGPATAATLRAPQGITLDPAGSVYIADTANMRIRSVLAAAPTFSVDHTSIKANSTAAGRPAVIDTLTLSSPVPGLEFTASSDSTWLTLSLTSGAIPASLNVTIDPSTLAAGSYHGVITLAAPLAVPGSITVNVDLIVAPGLPPKLSGSTVLSFSYAQGDTAGQALTTVLNTGGGSLDFAASVSGPANNWLSVSPSAGRVTAARPASLVVTADPKNLAVGTYTGTIQVSDADPSASIAITVNMTVTAPKQRIVTSHSALSFVTVAGGGRPLPQNLGIINAGQGALPWTAKAATLSGGSNWLAMSSTGGTVARPYLDTSAVDVSVNAAGLAPGDYYGQIQVASAGAVNSPKSVTVVLTVLPEGSDPGPEVRPSALVFTGTAGSSPGAQEVQIANLTSKPISFVSSRRTLDGKRWFAHAPASATINPDEPAMLIVQPRLDGLDAGVRRGTVTLQFADGSVRSISLLTVIPPQGSASQAASSGTAHDSTVCIPSQLNMVLPAMQQSVNAAVGQPVSVIAKIVDDCGQPLSAAGTNSSVSFSVSNADASASLTSLGGGVWAGTWQPQNPSTGPAALTVSASSTGPNQQLLMQSASVPVILSALSSTPILANGGIVNAASSLSDRPVAPGELISIYGQKLADGSGTAATSLPLSAALAGVQVRLADRLLPILYAGDKQLNVQVPYDLPLNTEQQMVLVHGTTTSVPRTLTIGPAQPAVFTVNQQGTGQGVVVNAATNIVADASAPVRAGDAVVIYCTGLGPIDSALPAGSAATGPVNTTSSASVSIGGKAAVVLYSGLTPGFPGLYQVNAVVPDGVTAGDQVTLTVSLAGETSPPVSIAVKP